MTRLMLFFLLVMAGLPSLSIAQIGIPFNVVGGGTADCLSAIPGDYTDYHGTGTATLLGDYVLDMATIGIRMPLTPPGQFPIEATFGNDQDNNVPIIFRSTENINEIAFNYDGIVTLTPVNENDLSEGFTALFEAEFVPVLDSGQGVFEDIMGGSFQMTAFGNTPFIPKGLDPLVPTENIPYEWTSDGGELLFVPEPSLPTALWALCLLCAVHAAIRRHRA